MISNSTYEVLDIWGDELTDLYWWSKASRSYIDIHQGGTYSGKTIANNQNIIDLAIENKNTTSTITSQDLPNLKRDALREFKKLIKKPNVAPFFENPNLEIGPYRLYNNSVIEFVCFGDMQDASGAKRDFLYINEAPGISWEIAHELIKRTEKKVLIDYNPYKEFWVHDELMHREDASIFISTFMDNRFNTEKKKREILSYYTKYLETKSEYWLNQWRVYGQGKQGIISGVVFPNVRKISQFPDDYYLKKNSDGLAFVYGLDFGLNDPACIGKCGVRIENDRIVAKECFYEPYPAFQMHQVFERIGIRKGIDIIVADSANMDAIELLAEKGYRMIAADKPPGSVKNRISLMNSHGIDVTYDSENAIKEQKQYSYKKVNGRFDPDFPEDKHNHFWDQLGYASMYWIYNKGESRRKVKKPTGKRRAYAY